MGRNPQITKDVMDQETRRVLEYKVNRKIPKPPSTVYQYWNEGAWLENFP